MMDFLKTVFILSHGNAFVERGFSIRKECVVENPLSKTLVAQKIVYDAVNLVGGINKVTISKKIIHAFRNARSLWGEALQRQQKL